MENSLYLPTVRNSQPNHQIYKDMIRYANTGTLDICEATINEETLRYVKHKLFLITRRTHKSADSLFENRGMNPGSVESNQQK